MTEPYRYDVKLAGGKVPIDVAEGQSVGIAVQDPVYVFTKEDDVTPRRTLLQGSEEYFIQRKTWFGATDKARMLVTIYES